MNVAWIIVICSSIALVLVAFVAARMRREETLKVNRGTFDVLRLEGWEWRTEPSFVYSLPCGKSEAFRTVCDHGIAPLYTRNSAHSVEWLARLDGMSVREDRYAYCVIYVVESAEFRSHEFRLRRPLRHGEHHGWTKPSEPLASGCYWRLLVANDARLLRANPLREELSTVKSLLEVISSEGMLVCVGPPSSPTADDITHVLAESRKVAKLFASIE